MGRPNHRNETHSIYWGSMKPVSVSMIRSRMGNWKWLRNCLEVFEPCICFLILSFTLFYIFCSRRTYWRFNWFNPKKSRICLTKKWQDSNKKTMIFFSLKEPFSSDHHKRGLIHPRVIAFRSKSWNFWSPDVRYCWLVQKASKLTSWDW